MLKVGNDINKRSLIYLLLLLIGIFSFYYFLYWQGNESLIIGIGDFFTLPGVYRAGGLETITALASFTSQSNTVYVTSCRTLSTSNTEYILQNDIVPDPDNISHTYCFTVSGSNITLNMNGKTVKSNESINSAFKVGVYISGTNVTVKNGRIQNFYWGLYPNLAINSQAENMHLYKNYNGLIIIGSTNFSIYNSTLDSNFDYPFYPESIVNVYNSTIKRTMYLFSVNENVSFYNTIFEDNLFFNHSSGYPYNGPVEGSRAQEIDFSVRLNNFSEILSYSISTYPSSSVTQSRSGQIVSGSFTPDKKGMYTLNVSMVDSKGNVYGSSHAIFIEPTRKTLKYYLRSLYSTNGQPAALNPAGDSGSLHFEQPTSEEYRDCGAWVQLSIEDLPPSILNAMTDLEFNIYYRGTTETYFGMKRYTDFSIIKDTQIQLPSSTSVTLGRGNLSLNWSSDYAWNNWNWYFSTLKIESYPIYMSTKPANLSWINLTYIEPTTFIRNLTDNSKILSIETYDNSNSSNISLLGNGNIRLDIYTPAFQPEIYFDGQKCSLSSDCEVLVSSNGNISLNLITDGIHQVYVSENVSILSYENISFYNLQSSILSGQSFNSSNLYEFSVSINSSVSLSNVFLSFGGINYSASLTNGNYNVSLFNLGAGNYSYYWIANNTNGQVNISQEYNYSISKTSFVPVLLLNSSHLNLSLIYGSLVNVSVGFSNGQDFNLYRNGVDIKSQNNLNQLLGAGYYNITAISIENQNYTSSSLVRFVNISRMTSTCSITGSNVTYPSILSISGSCTNFEASANLFRNNLLVSNPYNSLTGAGSYIFKLNVSQTQNYSLASSQLNISVYQNNSYNLSLSLTPLSALTYRDFTNISGRGCPSGISCNLYMNNLLRNNSDYSMLAAGSYTYYYNFSGNQNYSAKSTNLSFSIGKANGQATTLINGQELDISVLKGEIVNLTSYLVEGVGNLALYIDSNIINLGTSPVSNLTNFSSVGNYEIKTVYSGNDNYTYSQSNLTLGVYENEIVLPPNIFIFSPLSIIYNLTTIDFNISADLPSNCNYSVDGGSNVSLASNASFTGFYASKTFSSNGDYSIIFTCISQNGVGADRITNFSINYQTPPVNEGSPGEGSSSSGSGGGGGGGGGSSAVNKSNIINGTGKENKSNENIIDEDLAVSNQSEKEIDNLKKDVINRKNLVFLAILFSMLVLGSAVISFVYFLYKKFVLSPKI